MASKEKQIVDGIKTSQSSLPVIATMPEFKELSLKRRRMVLSLTLISLLVLLGNLLLMSVLGEQAARRLFAGSSISIAIAYSVFVVFFGAFVCSFYVFWANRKIDDLIDKIRSKALQVEQE